MECNKPNTLYEVFKGVIRLHFTRAHILLDKKGMYPGQPALLFALNKKDGQSQKEIAKTLNIKPSTITMMIKRMEKTGLIERKNDLVDNRVVRVYLTDKGREAFEQVKDVTKQIDEECFSNFSEEEKIIMRRLFMQMYENLEVLIERKGKND